MTTFWLCFRRDGAFAGVAIVDAGNLAGAAQIAWERGCNPGGEIVSVELPPSLQIDPSFRNRLLDRADATRLRDEFQKLMTSLH